MKCFLHPFLHHIIFHKHSFMNIRNAWTGQNQDTLELTCCQKIIHHNIRLFGGPVRRSQVWWDLLLPGFGQLPQRPSAGSSAPHFLTWPTLSPLAATLLGQLTFYQGVSGCVTVGGFLISLIFSVNTKFYRSPLKVVVTPLPGSG